MNKLQIRLSATALGSSGCILRFKRAVIDGYREKAMSSRIVYGISVHKFIDAAFKSGGNLAIARTAAIKAFSLPKIDDKKSMHLSDERHMINTCINLWLGFIAEESSFDILSVDGKPLTEQTFDILFYEDDYIEVRLQGTLDKIGQFRGGCFAIGDWKTTSSWDNRGYFKQYELSRALLHYSLALKLKSKLEPDGLIGKIGATKFGVFIDAIFVKPNPNENIVKRSTVWQKKDEEIEAYEDSLQVYCRCLSYNVKHGHLNRKEGIRNGSCQGKWGYCPYWNCCTSSDEVAELLLGRDFDKVQFNPLDYNNLNEEM